MFNVAIFIYFVLVLTARTFLFHDNTLSYIRHETMELTGRRGIAMLDFRKKVHHFVVNGGFVQETEAVVTDVMDTWLELANHVHPISIICNDQSKLDDAKLTKFEGHISAFIKLWIPFIGGYKNWQYYKLHTLTCGAIAFAKKYGMLGRANAQGFENKHFELRRHREILSRIPHRKVRVQKLAQRSQTMFIDGLSESLLFLEQADANGEFFLQRSLSLSLSHSLTIFLFLPSFLFLFFLSKQKPDVVASTISLLIEQG